MNMANVEVLKEKIEKAELKVEKCKGTIERHKKQMKKKIDKVVGLGIDITKAVDFKNLDEFKRNSEGGLIEDYWELIEVERKAEDIIGATKKLKEAEIILSNWKEKLNVELDKADFLEKNTPQVIKDFLEDWKNKSYEWCLQRYEKYPEFKKNLEQEVVDVITEYVESNPEECKRYIGKDGKIDEYWANMRITNIDTKGLRKYLAEKYLDYKSVKERKEGYAGNIVLHMYTIRNEEERLKWLDSILEQEKKAKMIDLINRINDVVGTITDASHLDIGLKGDINGYIIGTKGRAKVQTIGAGGYNIQRYHYRTLIDKY